MQKLLYNVTNVIPFLSMRHVFIDTCFYSTDLSEAIFLFLVVLFLLGILFLSYLVFDQSVG